MRQLKNTFIEGLLKKQNSFAFMKKQDHTDLIFILYLSVKNNLRIWAKRHRRLELRVWFQIISKHKLYYN